MGIVENYKEFAVCRPISVNDLFCPLSFSTSPDSSSFFKVLYVVELA